MNGRRTDERRGSMQVCSKYKTSLTTPHSRVRKQRTRDRCFLLHTGSARSCNAFFTASVKPEESLTAAALST
ncbi:hypothetical protein NDU88_007437 [Pleurodeles waltl]|uniref:Uncharacterized protein n=1 Tax=Pleurodeles waltl TaxID=8319 RepID=A0AAV7PL96_PLEWA|nr:hypothetical protein NDU88_007437 [Pleurodeles waltl]